MHQAVYDKLLSVAKARSQITYTELGNVADLDVSLAGQIDLLVQILDEIALHEIKAGRPLLPIVVMRADIQMPSKGLFKFAAKHGLLKDKDEMKFFAVELARVYEAWRGGPQPGRTGLR